FGRDIQLIKYIEKGELDHSRKIANKIIRDSSISAVIGLQDSAPTRPATQIYERGGILHLITAATMNDVIRPNMQFNFRLIPNNFKTAIETAEFCQRKGYHKMAILTERDDYAEELAKSFYDHALEIDIKI